MHIQEGDIIFQNKESKLKRKVYIYIYIYRERERERERERLGNANAGGRQGLSDLVKLDDVRMVQLLHDVHLAVHFLQVHHIKLRLVNYLDGNL
jgi:hypothetical protein